ncbi:hypothetical protein NXY00_10430 [Bacteroides sp. BFG-551]|nr:hypothetical protein [Bacteroides sp. BFG-551]
MKKKYLWGVAFCMLVCICSCSDQDDNLINPDKMIRMYGYSYNLHSGVIWQSNPNVIASSIPYIYEDTYEKDGTMVTDRVEGFCVGDEQIETGNFMLSLYETGLYGNMELEKSQGEGACICFHRRLRNSENWYLGSMCLAQTRNPILSLDIVRPITIRKIKRTYLPLFLKEKWLLRRMVIVIMSYFSVKRLLAEILRENITAHFGSAECRKSVLPNMTMFLCRG